MIFFAGNTSCSQEIEKSSVDVRNNYYLIGDYEGAVKLAYDSLTKKISGYIDVETANQQDVKKIYRSCKLVFISCEDKSSSEEKICVQYYSESKIVSKGYILLRDSSIYLQSDNGLGFCDDLLGLSEGTSFSFSEKANYQLCRYINKIKSEIYSSPSEETITKMYLVKNDIIMVDSVKNGWLHFEFSGKKNTKGWIRSEDIFPAP